ncbi:MAG TPA: transporter [Flavobacteriales bacterium]|nr:transporter [Flavobacteriales bacterium]
MKLSLIFIVLITVNSLIFSQSIITDRPDQTESSFSVEVGQLQIESGLLIEYIGEDKTNRNISLPSNLFRYGIYKGVELRLLNQIKFYQGKIGKFLVSDLELGVKVELFHNNSVNCAILTHLTLPTGSNELSNKEVQMINKFCISKDLNDEIGIACNIGYNYLSKDNEIYTYSIVLGSIVSESVSIYIEPFGEFIGLGNQTSSINTGLTYLLNNHFQLDYSFGLGLNHKMNYVSVGFSWRVG